MIEEYCTKQPSTLSPPVKKKIKVYLWQQNKTVLMCYEI